MLTLLPFCRMKISRNSSTTAKNPMESHRPLILVCLIWCCGSGTSRAGA